MDDELKVDKIRKDYIKQESSNRGLDKSDTANVGD